MSKDYAAIEAARIRYQDAQFAVQALGMALDHLDRAEDRAQLSGDAAAAASVATARRSLRRAGERLAPCAGVLIPLAWWTPGPGVDRSFLKLRTCDPSPAIQTCPAARATSAQPHSPNPAPVPGRRKKHPKVSGDSGHSSGKRLRLNIARQPRRARG